MLYIKAGAAKMAGAWFIHWPVRPVWPVRGLYGPQNIWFNLYPPNTVILQELDMPAGKLTVLLNY